MFLALIETRIQVQNLNRPLQSRIDFDSRLCSQDNADYLLKEATLFCRRY